MSWIIELLSISGYYAAPVGPLTIAALAMSVLGTGAGMIGSARGNKQRQANLDKEKAESKAFFDKEYYTSELDRTENQSALRTLTDRLKEQTQRSRATNAVTGATPEVALAQQNNANKAYADVANRLAGMASQRKSIIAGQRNADRRSLYGMQDGIDQSRQASWSNFAGNAASLGASALMADAYSKGIPAGTGNAADVTTGATGTIFTETPANLQQLTK